MTKPYYCMVVKRKNTKHYLPILGVIVIEKMVIGTYCEYQECSVLIIHIGMYYISRFYVY